jgi:hypothetical protein
MPIFYHYTCLENLGHIFSDGFIKTGQIAVTATTIAQGKAVSLTTDSSSVGHGLPDGRKIKDGEITKLPIKKDESGSLVCADHTEIRFTLRLPDTEPRLISASNFYSGNPAMLYALEISGYFPIEASISESDQHEVELAIATGKLIGKGGTWWYFFDVIPCEWILVICEKRSDGFYHPIE